MLGVVELALEVRDFSFVVLLLLMKVFLHFGDARAPLACLQRPFSFFWQGFRHRQAQVFATHNPVTKLDVMVLESREGH